MASTSKALLMAHEVDPKTRIYDTMGAFVDEVTVMGAQLVVGVYMRPEKTRSGIILSADTRSEDRYQGKVGLVLKKGPLAFVEDDRHSFGERTPQVGDWIMFRVGDTFAFHLGGSNDDNLARIVEDVDVKAILARPDIVL